MNITPIESRLGAYLSTAINHDYDAMRYTHHAGNAFLVNLLGPNFEGLKINVNKDRRRDLIEEINASRAPAPKKNIGLQVGSKEASAYFMRLLAEAIGFAFKQTNDNAASEEIVYNHEDFIDDMKRGMQAQLHAAA